MHLGGRFSSEFVENFLNHGFAALDIPRATQHQIDDVFERGTRFFETDRDSKMPAALPLDTGYRPFGVEYSSAPTRPDQMVFV